MVGVAEILCTCWILILGLKATYIRQMLACPPLVRGESRKKKKKE